ncbi:4-carboxy-4-hydroxy-2-oxoadipate aldolase/oxaloacetate decarboxylase [Pseudomonas sediminis]|uniref:4-carboxy-4-hydroxy-2-oxoadipate aldolase/oxaloacetate decarboxylase n=1 Tax=Pseudomonas sediminis TaxID=1691904 RepID=UPI00244A5463|nr:4-carboxy-4-hydroxy-2-oxoadipate aldolase/oxaloacetate decarboxylase [Pseudomonas sediminis]MDG9759970.1 4-carboxy-4-hydroxy-2-oxoadipate aldolase/oxaloacetate decarboxylase [Pseudomonas sediminis]
MIDNLRSEELARQLSQLGSATIYEAQGAFGALDAGMKPLSPGMKVAGPVFTVDVRPGDNLMLHYALLHVQPGDVLVVDAKAFIEAGPWGDILTEQALHKGVAGLVINGSVRDVQAIQEMGFAVFCRGVSIKGTAKKQSGKINVAVTIGDVTIQPGDYIFGDVDGLVVVPAANLSSVLESALAREHVEANFRMKIREGVSTVELLELNAPLSQMGLV